MISEHKSKNKRLASKDRMIFVRLMSKNKSHE